MKKPLGIYVHYPFCKSLCPYCDFNSFVKDGTNEEHMVASYTAELDYYRERIADGYSLVSIYFGGGTPSLMSSESVKKIIDHARNIFYVPGPVEITLEANPTSVENQKLVDFKKAGINRVSIGIQALNNEDLAFLGRKHSAEEAVEAINIAKEVFDNFSLDLIHTRHNQHTVKSWQKELERATSLARDHMSLYTLTIEKGTEFFSRKIKNDLPLATQKQSDDMYFFTIDFMRSCGFKRYEISNFAKNNKHSVHNMLYWQTEDYLGIGPGAHGRIFYKNGQRMQTMTFHLPEKWLKLTNHSTGVVLQKEQPLTIEEQVAEILMMGMRTTHGVDFDKIRLNLGINMTNHINPRGLETLISDGLVTSCGQKIVPTEQGINFANRIAKVLSGML